MAFLVAGTLQVASQIADARESLGRKGKYSMRGPRVALTLSSPEVSASVVAVLEGVFRTLGFESCQRREASVQGFLGELAAFREQLDALGGPVGCALVALVAPRGQLKQPQQLVRELSRCGALWGRPKVFLLLSSAPGAAPEPGAFLTGLSELCGRFPHWSLLQLLTEVFCRTAEESEATYCPVLRSSLRGALCLGDVEPWGPGPEPSPTARYDLSGTRAALLLSVIHGRPGAQHDVEALGALCQALSFKTTLRTDPTAQAFQEELAQFRECLDAHRAPVSCALVALMAHGGPQGQLLGADGREVRPEALVQELSRCRALCGCPKIFLLQVCRGGEWGPNPHLPPPVLASHTQPSATQDLLSTFFRKPERWCFTCPISGSLRASPRSQVHQLEHFTLSSRCSLLWIFYSHGAALEFWGVGYGPLETPPRCLLSERACVSPPLPGHRDAGVGSAGLPWFRRWLRASPTTPSHADVLQIYADVQGSSDQADILTVYAAAEGCVAYRDETGSDFIQTLVEVFRADPGREVLELLTEVNRRVCQLEVLGPDCPERRKACLEIRSSLRRRLCLQA
ncbi:uncharacterized protein LOC131501012 isoform X3 [Neofelis nebulosa]|uniref:uncharacterized protein LOC131501012 isoform X3 n=1 Tax=Neofelis nebulosa TaxID=61452 RepID=UPI00272BC335|nr:uncharacterized protein LOC131501012 isoform X3 [Neofelis nebulosa]